MRHMQLELDVARVLNREVCVGQCWLINLPVRAGLPPCIAALREADGDP
jgi:hypothetical protein